MNKWWNDYEYKSSWNDKNNKKLSDKNDPLNIYRNKVQDYFRLEFGERLSKIFSRDNIHSYDKNKCRLHLKVSMIIASCFVRKESINNCAGLIKEFLDKN